MKITRSYWLGLGSGLILSAMLTMVLSPLQGQGVAPRDSSPVNDVKQPPNPSEPDPIKSSMTTQPTQVDQFSEQSTTTPIDRQFVIPKGASAEKIADQLVAQGFIKDKETFLVDARQKRVERRFTAGTFNLSMGLTTEELLQRLVK
ncbi:endolytic transglycosylase MltG [Desulfosporosinus burensis]